MKENFTLYLAILTPVNVDFFDQHRIAIKSGEAMKLMKR